MVTKSSGSRIVPVLLAAVMLSVILAAGLAPNTGVVQASSSCTYGNCPSAAAFPSWAIGGSVAIALLALLVGLLLLRRRRRKRQGGDGEAPAAGAAGTARSDEPVTEGPGEPPADSAAWSEPTTSEGEAEPPADDAYRES